MFAEGAAWLQGLGDSLKESMAAGQKGFAPVGGDKAWHFRRSSRLKDG